MIAAIFALSLNLLVGYGGLTSLGTCRVPWRCRLFIGMVYQHAPALATAPRHCVDYRHDGVRGFVRPDPRRSLRTGFPDDYVGVVAGLWGLAYRWVSVTNGDNGMPGSTRPMPFGISIESAASFYWFALIVHRSRPLS